MKMLFKATLFLAAALLAAASLYVLLGLSAQEDCRKLQAWGRAPAWCFEEGYIR